MTTSMHRRLLLSLVILSTLPTLLVAPHAGADAPGAQFAAGPFNTLWTRTDSLVASGQVQRTWFWGPQPDSPGLLEDYAEGVGGKRLVQYFDKSRMEINDPTADPSSSFYVSNGLLTVELISGRMQTGDDTFVQRLPSQTNVTGDMADPLAPTYADLAHVSNALGARRDPDRTSQPVTATLSRGGKAGSDPSKLSVPGATNAYYEQTSGHNIPQVMWDFLNSHAEVSIAGTITQSQLIDPWFYASGLPISDAYWVKATIAGKPTDVLLQAFERRVLTYVPTNPDGFKVEMGNIGQHYYDWRYKGGADPEPTPLPAGSPTPSPSTATAISRFAVDILADTSTANLNNVKSTGAGAVRVQIPWGAIEPRKSDPSSYNWAYSDAIYKALSDRGLQPISLIEDCPVWACTRPSGPIRDDNLPDFVTFMAAMSARYSSPPYNAHYWELWNEPDGIGDAVPGTTKRYGWGSNPDRYVQMLQAIRPAVKSADPQAMIVLGGLAYDAFQEDGGPFNRSFLDDVLDAGGGQYLDALNFHYYPNSINWCSFTDKLAELRSKAATRGLNLPFISTETGFSSDPQSGLPSGTGSSQGSLQGSDMQSIYVLQAYAQTAGDGLLTTAWFVAHDYSSPGTIFGTYGLFNLSGAAKPATNAYKTAAAMIGQRPAVRTLGRGDGLSGTMRGYEFATDAQHQGKLWVVWSWDQNASGRCGAPPAPTTFVIPGSIAPQLSRALDMYGQPLVPHTRPDGSLAFPLDAHPIYLEWTNS